MTTAQQEEFLEHMRAGMRRGAAAEVLGLTRMEVMTFIRENSGFEEQVLDAEGLATEHVEEALYQAAVSGSVPAAKLWLDLKRPRHASPPMAAPPDEDNVTSAMDDDLAEIWRMTTE